MDYERGATKTGTTQVTVKPGEELPRGETDWARVNAMTDEEVMAAALSDPDAQPLDPEALAKMRRVSPVKVLRQRLGMTQTEFAEAFLLPISTLRDWEQHRSIPDAPARALLRAIDRDPETMRRLLSEAASTSGIWVHPDWPRRRSFWGSSTLLVADRRSGSSPHSVWAGVVGGLPRVERHAAASEGPADRCDSGRSALPRNLSRGDSGRFKTLHPIMEVAKVLPLHPNFPG